ncbi:MAG TPA: serine/threonine-protein kinase [Pyrinomonadaceae bacterium]|nr:serine/threonine-protein kinase [Pyrinomonadaceae bacterium]
MKCSSCETDIPDERQTCPSCGTALDDSFTPTRRLEDLPKFFTPRGSQPSKRVSYSSARSSSGTIDDARFVSGTMLAGRYRIVGLLGRGGMGEVYRADDIKLGQPVALKFLPESLWNDGAALARFHREVRVARQVSHRNVCRVYDIGELDNQHYLSMELIKGEELSSLLKRIGRLPPDKAVEIARQLCAGLAAAHETGVLHRDLKPSNVMIDDAGNVRITDFGLAGLSEELQHDERRAGTPAYMSPEQLEGEELTPRSDIYSLGLVLYEVFTGKRAFEASSLNELIELRRKSDATPTSPSSLVKEIDPLVERVILRCLEKDAEKRPASALQVAAMLPGGDPLQAALAAGETPSPEMVAAAPKMGSLRPVVAVSMLASVILMLGLTMLLSKQVTLHRMVPLEKSPEVLKQRASEITRKLGYTAKPTDTAYSFMADFEYLRYIRQHDSSRTRWDRLATGQPSAVRFWYRQSPRYLVPRSMDVVLVDDPPHDISGMVLLSLDTEGRLFYFDAVPPQLDQGQGESAPPDWSPVFQEAGLNFADFQQTASQWTPRSAYDERVAWNGTYPGVPDFPIRIEAASYRGLPIYFEIVSPWRRPEAQVPYQPTASDLMGTIALLTVFFGTLVEGAWLALKNIRAGRGDRRGAFRVAIFIFALRMIYWVIAKHHVQDTKEFMLLLTGAQSALFWACVVGLMYLALEPYLRRRWPERVISWSRLLAGDFRDPLVGRDILIGAVLGCACLVLSALADQVPRWLGLPPNSPYVMVDSDGTTLNGVRGFVPLLINQLSASVVQTFIIVFLLLFMAMLLRKNILGLIVGWLLLATVFTLMAGGGSSLVSWPFHIGVATLFVIAATRFGPVALISTLIFIHLRVFFPITTELTAWYAGDLVLDLIFLVALAFFGFYTSLAGQPVFSGGLLKED